MEPELDSYGFNLRFLGYLNLLYYRTEMKNSLSTNSLIPIISSWKDFSDEISRASSAESVSDVFPLDVHGLNGSLNAFYIAEYMRKRHFARIHKMQYEQKMLRHQEDFLIIVSSQKDADECE